MIKKNEILFLFNQNQNDKIELIPEYPVSKLDFSDESIILLVEDSKELTLCEDTARESLYALQHLLPMAIDKKLQLHPSIKDNIGFLYNEDLKNYLSHKFRDKSLWTKQMMSDGYFFEKNDLLTYELVDNVYRWVGEKYLLWEHEVVSWIYNDAFGNIILEITPKYPGNWKDSEKDHYMTYEQWIPSYKSITKKIIPHSIAQEWLKEINIILDIIEKNTEEYCKKHCDETSHYYLKD